MTCCLFAIGKQGIRSCQALLDAALTGILNEQEIRFVLIGAEQKEAEALQGLIENYRLVRGRLVQSGYPRFTCQLDMRIVSEEGLDASLQERCETDADKLLLNCLFSRERMLRRSAASSVETAQAAWADFLRNSGEDAIVPAIEDMGEDDRILVSGSLTETLFAGGCVQLLRLIPGKCAAQLCAVLALPLHQSDRTDLVQGVVKELPETDAVYVYGLPEDLRTEGDGMDELVALRCMEHFLAGGRGVYTYAQEIAVPDWSFFGERENDYREGMTSLLHLGLLMMLQYGPDALERLERSSTGYLRGWFGKVYGQIRRNPDRTSEERLYLRALLHLLRFHTAWCYLVTGNLPLSLRYQAQLHETEQKASAHYDDVMNAAGRLALLSHDTEKSGILEEETVHRASMEDTEGEAARKTIVELAEKLQQLAAQQYSMEEILGGRAAFMLLQGKLDTAEREAEQLRSQEKEASRRIEEAAQTALPEERPKIDAARSRLRNLQRHLVFLDGRVEYVRRDVERARLEENRNRKPHVEYTEETEPNVLFDRRVLREAIAVYDGHGGERRRDLDALIGSVSEIDLLHLRDLFDRQGQEMDGTADMMNSLYQLWKQASFGRDAR